MIFGNGGSAAIASHVSVDMTKNIKVKAMNFNEADLITCFSNDYGYEKWIEKAIEFYGNKGDILILISSSGKSKNMLNACKAARRKKIQKLLLLLATKKITHFQNLETSICGLIVISIIILKIRIRFGC